MRLLLLVTTPTMCGQWNSSGYIADVDTGIDEADQACIADACEALVYEVTLLTIYVGST